MERKPEIKYQRMGDKGVLTETFPDGSWRSICRPVNDWLRIASRIQEANREPKVVGMKRPGGVA